MSHEPWLAGPGMLARAVLGPRVGMSCSQPRLCQQGAEPREGGAGGGDGAHGPGTAGSSVVGWGLQGVEGQAAMPGWAPGPVLSQMTSALSSGK